MIFETPDISFYHYCTLILSLQLLLVNGISCPFYTNAYAHFRDLDPDFSFWRSEYYGSFLVAIAHAFVTRLSVASIASTYDFANLEP